MHPGDRAEECGGMMEPIRIEGVTGRYILIHRCIVCAVERRNKVAAEDDMNVVVGMAKNSLRSG